VISGVWLTALSLSTRRFARAIPGGSERRR
jgi:hypothetical protein